MTDEWSFTWRGFLARTIDGDTVDLFIDKGDHTYGLNRIRLLGINAPENETTTKVAGQSAKDYVQRWMEDAHATAIENVHFEKGMTFTWPLAITTKKSDSFNRYLGLIIVRAGDGVSLNDALLQSGHAVAFMV